MRRLGLPRRVDGAVALVRRVGLVEGGASRTTFMICIPRHTPSTFARQTIVPAFAVTLGPADPAVDRMGAWLKLALQLLDVAARARQWCDQPVTDRAARQAGKARLAGDTARQTTSPKELGAVGPPASGPAPGITR
ncbi:hypothetical protein DLJ53_09155 [Acuticoccus sediminis]|uniref:Uncharacterized protein n=1 Tax=Acuticoccus sediminis TaxID=2184697 RepID=A0A8B2NYA9_9HYPH|nr:hypothetical protein DLJ53_09155 [Acuticoccus sediminis]